MSGGVTSDGEIKRRKNLGSDVLPNSSTILGDLTRDVRHFEELSRSVPGSEEEALLALASTSKLYGDRPDIAKYGDGEVSTPDPGHSAKPIDHLMLNELGEKLTHEATRLLDPEANLDGTPDAYWDQALIHDEEKYVFQIGVILLHLTDLNLC